MNSRIINYAGALLLGLLMATAMDAQPRQGGRGHGARGPGDGTAHGQYGGEKRFAGLELTEEQQVELKALRAEHFKEINPLRNKMAELKARERTLMSEEHVDMKAVEGNIDAQTDLLNSMRKLQTRHQLDVKKILTDEQVMMMQQRRSFARDDAYYGKGSHRGDRGMRMNRDLQPNHPSRMNRGTVSYQNI